MRTKVTRIGRAVPQRFRGTVRAVWHRALAVELSAGTHAGPAAPAPALVTLVRRDVPMTAASIALDAGEEFDFARAGFGPGDAVACDGSAIEVGRPGGGCTIRAQGVAYARVFEGTLPPARASVAPELLVDVARQARERRAAAGTRLHRAATARCDVVMEQLAMAAMAGDAPAVAAAAHALVGLGPGLTPAGDDVLCGFMAGRRIAQAGTGVLGAGAAVDQALGAIAASADGRTPDCSAVQLWLAAHGRYGEALLAVVLWLAAGGPPRGRDVIARCADQGATSGADGLAGLVAGVSSAAAPVRAAAGA